MSVFLKERKQVTQQDYYNSLILIKNKYIDKAKSDVCSLKINPKKGHYSFLLWKDLIEAILETALSESLTR